MMLHRYNDIQVSKYTVKLVYTYVILELNVKVLILTSLLYSSSEKSQTTLGGKLSTLRTLAYNLRTNQPTTNQIKQE